MTVCATCRWLHGDAKKDDWWRWMCAAAPLPAWDNPVTGLTLADPPYQLCKKINLYGTCPMYEAGPNVLQPKETENAH